MKRGTSNHNDIPGHQNILTRRIELTKRISAYANQYISKISEYVAGTSKDKYNNIINAIELCANPELGPHPSNYIEASAFANKMEILDNAVNVIVDMFHNPQYIKMVVYNMSSTYTKNVFLIKASALETYLEYTSLSDTRAIYKAIIEAEPDLYAAGMDLVDVNAFTIELLRAAIKTSTGERRRKLILRVESRKDILFKSKRMDGRPYSGIHGRVIRGDLVPIGRSAHIDKMEPPYIIINMAGLSPVEYDIRGYIDSNYIKSAGLEMSPTSGLTKKTLIRYTSTSVLNASMKSRPIYVHGDTSSQSWNVYETIDGASYRQLSYGASTSIPRDKVRFLLDGVTTRPADYSKIMSKRIIGSCYDTLAPMLLREYEMSKTHLPSGEVICRIILEKMSAHFVSKINTINNMITLRDVAINRDNITVIIIETLGERTTSSERLLSYIAQFDSIITTFIKELGRRWANAATNKAAENILNSGHKQHLLDIFTEVTSASISSMDAKNMWTSIDVSIKDFFSARK
jgi:hypothetical protein